MTASAENRDCRRLCRSGGWRPASLTLLNGVLGDGEVEDLEAVVLVLEMQGRQRVAAPQFGGRMAVPDHVAGIERCHVLDLQSAHTGRSTTPRVVATFNPRTFSGVIPAQVRAASFPASL
jgi:hypothetical protein